jgi:uncharacterized protein with FMN-binding domain
MKPSRRARDIASTPPSELRMVPEPAVAASTEPVTSASPASEPQPVHAADSPAPAPVVVASAAPPSPAAPAAPAAPAWKDGTYTGWGYSRHGDIEARVVVEKGRIISAVISQCRTRYSCDVIDMLPPQVVERQSPEVDYVSGATQSADAFYGGVVAALDSAK